jgi:hypothetical protein
MVGLLEKAIVGVGRLSIYWHNACKLFAGRFVDPEAKTAGRIDWSWLLRDQAGGFSTKLNCAGFPF